MWRETPLDAIDRKMLNDIKQNPSTSISNVIRPYLDQRSETVLRGRIRGLELRGLIRTERTKQFVLCFPEEEGLAVGGMSR